MKVTPGQSVLAIDTATAWQSVALLQGEHIVALLEQDAKGSHARSLLGAARAAAQTGDQAGAAATYAKLLEQWSQADQELAELREARDFVKSHPQITQKN